MKLRLFLPAALALPLSGCGFLGHTLNTVTGTATNLVRTVVSPVSGVLHGADEGSEKAWQQKADARTPNDQKHDRRGTQAKRPR